MNTQVLTFYRFIAASVVVVFHFGQGTGLSKLAPGFFSSGPEMVTFFFVLSGFIMALTCLDKGNFSSSEYWINRFSKIYPIYLIAALIMILCFGDHDLANDPWAITLQITMLQAWFPPYPLTVNVPAWSLSVEAFFYAIFPFVLLCIKNLKISAKGFLIFCFLLWGFTQLIHINLLNHPSFTETRHFIYFLVRYFPLSHLCSFLLGIAAYHWLTSHQHLLQKKWQADVLLGIALAVVFIILTIRPTISGWVGLVLPFDGSLLSPLFFLLVVASVRCDNLLTRFLSLRVFIILGESSYAIYILQKPAQEIYYAYFYQRLPITPDQHFYALFALLLVMSLVATYLIETPVKNLIRRTANRF